MSSFHPQPPNNEPRAAASNVRGASSQMPDVLGAAPEVDEGDQGRVAGSDGSCGAATGLGPLGAFAPPPGAPPKERSPPRRCLSGSREAEVRDSVRPLERAAPSSSSHDRRRSSGDSPMISSTFHPPSASVDAPLAGAVTQDLAAVASTVLVSGSGSTLVSTHAQNSLSNHHNLSGSRNSSDAANTAAQEARLLGAAANRGSLVSDADSSAASPVTTAAAGVALPLARGPHAATHSWSFGTPATSPGAPLSTATPRTAAAGTDIVVSVSECGCSTDGTAPSTLDPDYRATQLLDSGNNASGVNCAVACRSPPAPPDDGSENARTAVFISWEPPRGTAMGPAPGAALCAGPPTVDLNRPNTAAPVSVAAANNPTSTAIVMGDDMPPPLLQVELLSNSDDSSCRASSCGSSRCATPAGPAGSRKLVVGRGTRRGGRAVGRTGFGGVMPPTLGVNIHTGGGLTGVAPQASQTSDFAPGASTADTVRPMDLSRDNTCTFSASREVVGASPLRAAAADDECVPLIAHAAALNQVFVSIELGGAALPEGGVIAAPPAPHGVSVTASASSQALRGSATSYPARQRIVGFSAIDAGSAVTATPSLVMTPPNFTAAIAPHPTSAFPSQLPPYRARATAPQGGATGIATPPLHSTTAPHMGPSNGVAGSYCPPHPYQNHHHHPSTPTSATPTGGGSGLLPHPSAAPSMSTSSRAAAAAAAAVLGATTAPATTSATADALQHALRQYIAHMLPDAAAAAAERHVEDFLSACRLRASSAGHPGGAGSAQVQQTASPAVQVDGASHRDGDMFATTTTTRLARISVPDGAAAGRKRSDTRPPSNAPPFASALSGSGDESGAAGVHGDASEMGQPTAHTTATLLADAIFGADTREVAALRVSVEAAVQRVLRQHMPAPHDDGDSSGAASPVLQDGPTAAFALEVTPPRPEARHLPEVSIVAVDGGTTTDESTATTQCSPHTPSVIGAAQEGAPDVVVLPPDAEPMTRSVSRDYSRAGDSIVTVAASGVAVPSANSRLPAAQAPSRAPTSADMSASSIAVSSVTASAEPGSPGALLRGSTTTSGTAVADSAAGSPVRMLRGLRASSGGHSAPRQAHAQSAVSAVMDDDFSLDAAVGRSVTPALHPGYSFTNGTVAGSSALAARRLSRVRTVITPGAGANHGLESATASATKPPLLRPEMCFTPLGALEHNSPGGTRAPLIPPALRGLATTSIEARGRMDGTSQTIRTVPPFTAVYLAAVSQDALVAALVDAATVAASRASAAALSRIMGVVMEALEAAETARMSRHALPSPQHPGGAHRGATGSAGTFSNDSFGTVGGYQPPLFMGGGSRASRQSSMSSWAAYSRGAAPAGGAGVMMATFGTSPSLGGPPSVGSATVFRPSGAPVPPPVTLSPTNSPNLGNSVTAVSVILPAGAPGATNGPQAGHASSGQPGHLHLSNHHGGHLHPLQRADSIATSMWGISLSEPVPVPTATAVDAAGEHEVDGTYTLNQYVVLHAIGHGTQGSVMFAMDTQANVFRAIKAIPRPGGALRGAESRAAQMQQLRQQQRIKREVDAMHRCGRHPGIVQLYEVIDDPTHPTLYLVTQYAEGGSVATCSSVGAIDRQYSAVDVSSMGRQLCNALQHMHGRGVVHRDIKPENILACSDGRVMLCDFGMADVVMDASGATPLAPPARSEFLTSMDSAASAGGASVAGGLYGLHQQHAHGTRAFYSPEQWSSIKAESPEKCDVWALGLTLYVLYYGRLPWPVHPVGHYMHHILHEDIPFPPPAAAAPPLDAVGGAGEASGGPLPAVVPPMPSMLQEALRVMLKRDPRERCDVRTARTLLRTAHVALLGIEAATTALENGGRVAGSRRQSNVRVQPPPALVELAAVASHSHAQSAAHSASLLFNTDGAGAGAGGLVDPPRITAAGTEAAAPNPGTTSSNGCGALPFATTSLRSGVTRRSMLSLRSGVSAAAVSAAAAVAAASAGPVRRIADVFSDDDDADVSSINTVGGAGRSSRLASADGSLQHAPVAFSAAANATLAGHGDLLLDNASRAGSGVTSSSHRSGVGGSGGSTGGGTHPNHHNSNPPPPDVAHVAAAASQSMSPNFGLIMPHYRHSSSGISGVSSGGGAAVMALDSASGRGSSSNPMPRLQLPLIAAGGPGGAVGHPYHPAPHASPHHVGGFFVGGEHHHHHHHHQLLEPGSPLAMTTRVASGFVTQEQLQAAARLASSQLIASGHFGVSVVSMGDHALSTLLASTEIAEPALLLQ